MLIKYKKKKNKFLINIRNKIKYPNYKKKFI